jgi:hypothetical protein
MFHNLMFIFHSGTILNYFNKIFLMGWAGHVACRGKGGVCTGFWWGNLREDTPGETQA